MIIFIMGNSINSINVREEVGAVLHVLLMQTINKYWTKNNVLIARSMAIPAAFFSLPTLACDGQSIGGRHSARIRLNDWGQLYSNKE